VAIRVNVYSNLPVCMAARDCAFNIILIMTDKYGQVHHHLDL
jgi:hypothetical protein